MENAIPTSRRKITYPTPSLNKLSPAILVSKPFESFACFSIPITATGSVGEINAPKIKAKIKGSPVNKLNPNPMIIVDNNKNENNFLLNNENKNDEYMFLEINFISITNNFTFYFDKLLENHQINIKRYMSGDYIKSFFDIESKESMELFVMANKLNDGLNKNEVQLISKSKENKGFFEKFFQLFS